MTTQRCELCGAILSRYNSGSLCAPCTVARRRGLRADGVRVPTASEHVTAVPSWLWASPSTRRALASQEIGQVFIAYRSIHHLTQHQLGELLGFDQSYVCRIENGRRVIRDVPTLSRIATRLGLPPRLLGLMTKDDDDFEAMCQFAESTLRLTDIARRSGRPMEAVRELWPLVARLESRSSNRPIDPDIVVLLADACLALGTALGDVLPEEKLSISARWTRRALDLSEWLGDSALRVHALNLHGNELRKSGDHAGATRQFAAALNAESNVRLRGDTFMLLARAKGEMGDPDGFDRAIRGAESLLHECTEMSSLFNPFSMREARIRGLLATGRRDSALLLVNDDSLTMAYHGPVPPQWQVIERITVAGVLVAGGDVRSADDLLSTAIADAETSSLPHQVQRSLRIAQSMPPADACQLVAIGEAALRRLRVSPLPAPLEGMNGTTRP